MTTQSEAGEVLCLAASRFGTLGAITCPYSAANGPMGVTSVHPLLYIQMIHAGLLPKNR